MDREIKFRAWDGIEMLKVSSISVENILVTKKPYQRHKDKIVIMQYTGLKDSKGVDIYENDITNNGVVKRFDGLHRDSGGSIHPGWYFDLGYNRGYQELYYTIGFDDVIVLGNIYENPDLLPKPTDG